MYLSPPIMITGFQLFSSNPDETLEQMLPGCGLLWVLGVRTALTAARDLVTGCKLGPKQVLSQLRPTLEDLSEDLAPRL